MCMDGMNTMATLVLGVRLPKPSKDTWVRAELGSRSVGTSSDPFILKVRLREVR